MLPRRQNLYGLSLLDDDFINDFFGKPIFRKAGMETDIREKDGKYFIDINLPGFNKEDVKVSYENGYLTVEASKDTSKEEKNEKGNYIIKERYSGSLRRSIYIGEDINEDEINAAFVNGTLTLTIPQNSNKEIENKKYITIQ